MDHIEYLNDLYACEDAVDYAAQFTTLQEAWTNCKRGDWMLWLLGRRRTREPGSDRHKTVVLLACQCARLVLKYVPEGEDRPRLAIEAAEAWAKGEDMTLDKAYDAACAAAAAADATYAACAAAAAADAAYAACAAAAAADANYAALCADMIRAEVPNIEEWLKC